MIGPNLTHARRILAKMEISRAIHDARMHPLALRLQLIGGIGAAWPENGRTVRAIEVASVLRRDRHAPVHAIIGSGGGSMVEAFRIHDEISGHRGVTVATVSMRAHSAAAMILSAAEVRIAKPPARFLLHAAGVAREALSAGRVDARDLRRLADDLDADTQRMVRLFATACGDHRDLFADRIAAGREIGTWDARMIGLLHAIEFPNGNLGMSPRWSA